MEKRIKILTDDSYEISGTLFRANSKKTDTQLKRILIVQGGIGIPRSFYSAFARYIQRNGIHVVTFDYRGISGSISEEGYEFNQAKLEDWARLDAQSVYQWVLRNFPDHLVTILGHSFGGQAVALMKNTTQISSLILVGAQASYWNNFEKLMKIQTFLLWHFLIPVFSHLVGKFPAKAMSLGEDLPKNVALQWAEWSRNRDYFFEHMEKGPFDGYSGIPKIISIRLSDDSYAPMKAVEWIEKQIGPRLKEKWVIRPSDYGESKLGHFGLFRPQVNGWAPYWDWILGLIEDTKEGPSEVMAAMQDMDWERVIRL